MLRVLMRKCFYCSKFHENGIQIKSFFSTEGTKKVDIDCGGSSTLEISSGRLARLADGTAVARLGNTSVMTTVVSKGKSTQNFLPLTVDYRQKAAAAGRIPTNYLRRELGPSEREILVGRMIDRSVRPLFNKGYNIETGINCNLMSVDGVNDPEVLSINSTSAAISLSDVPWGPAVGAVRLGYLGGQLIVNPTRKQLSQSELNLVVAGTTGGLATMLEGDAKCLDHKTFLEAIKLGLTHCATIADSIEKMGKEMGKTKRKSPQESELGAEVRELHDLVDTLCSGQLRMLYTDYSLDKLSRDGRMFTVRDNMISQIRRIKPETDGSLLSDIFSKISTNIVRSLIFEENLRVDGRSSTDLRPISCDVNLHSPLHGSALFQRGQTQVFCTVALDSLHSAMKLDPMSVITGGVKEKNFMLHYEFPGYATGDLGKGGSRRELGHGALAERALRQVLPAGTQFTVRLTSEVLESNGSSSMASICGGSLALLDAGIPLSEMASGVAMGLVTRGGEQRVLTDIMGMEDFLGDMDFKFAATRSGVCALQSDVKIRGISLKVIEEAVEGGVEANHKILDIMAACIHTPREHKDCWPVSRRLEVPPHKRGKFLGPAGLNVKKITQDTGVQISAESEGVWQLFAPNPEAMLEAETTIEEILAEEKVPELQFGGIYTGKITEILDRGVMVQLHEQMSPVLLHNTQLSARKIQHPSVLGLKVGEELQVKYYGRDPATGQMRLSRKAIQISSAAAVKNLQDSAKRKDDQGPSPPPPGGDGGASPPAGGGPACAPTPPPRSAPRLQINENKADIFSFTPQEYWRIVSESKSESMINKSDLFVRKESVQVTSIDMNKTEASSELQGSFSCATQTIEPPSELQGSFSCATNTETKLEDFCEQEQLEYVQKKLKPFVPAPVPFSAKEPDNLFIEQDRSIKLPLTAQEEVSDLLEMEEAGKLKQEAVVPEESDATYYEIDRLFNLLMSLNMEIKEAMKRKANVDREWMYVKETHISLENSSRTSLLPGDFNSDRVTLVKKFSSQSKAINESLLLLTRQYREIKEDLDNAQLMFIKAKNPSVAENIMKQLAKSSILIGDIPEPADLYQNYLSVDNKEEIGDVNPDPERYKREVIGDLVTETLRQSSLHRLNQKPSSAIQSNPRHSADDARQSNPSPSVSRPSFRPKPDQLWPSHRQTQPIKSDSSFTEQSLPFSETKDVNDSTHDLERREIEAKPFSERYLAVKQPKSFQAKVNLEGFKVETGTKLAGGPETLSPENQAGIPFKIKTYRKEMIGELNSILKRHEEGTGLSDGLDCPRVLQLVKNNHHDFHKLLRWLKDMNGSGRKDLELGMSTIYSNLKSNLLKLESSHRFINSNRSAVDFIARHLSRTDHPLVGLAHNNLTQLEAIRHQTLVHICETSSMSSSLQSVGDLDPQKVWEEYLNTKTNFNQILLRLWEVELSDERMADLDDWRGQQQSTHTVPTSLQEIEKKIDEIQRKIDSFSKVDLEKNWSVVEKNLHQLQGLKVEGLISWLTETDTSPDWLYPGLKGHLLQNCYRYRELDNQRRDLNNSWFKLGRKDGVLDISLDVLYSQIRTSMAKVKYASLENGRHRDELRIYATWIHQSKLTGPKRRMVETLLNLAEEKVVEVEKAVKLYVEVINSSQEYARDAATVLDKMREEKRKVMSNLIFHISRSIRSTYRKGTYLSPPMIY